MQKKGNKEKNRAFHNKTEIRDKMESTVCKNESCQLGCICESIQGTSIQKKRNEWGVLRIKPDHCNKLVCMFDCVCHLPKEKKQREKNAQCWFLLILVSLFCMYKNVCNINFVLNESLLVRKIK